MPPTAPMRPGAPTCRAGAAGRDGFRLGHRPVLDGLRGLAVLTVMAYHSDLRCVLRGGYLAVDVFFVLSGLLITALLLREHQDSGGVRLPRFYLRRALRLYPALCLMLGFCCCWATFRSNPSRAGVIYRAVAVTACHAANWSGRFSISLDILSHAWSLSLEEQFYLVWPAALFLLLRAGVSVRRIGWLVLMGMAASAAIRAGLWLAWQPAGADAAGAALPVRTDSLLAGCLVALASFAGAPRPSACRLLRAAAWPSAALLLLFGVFAEPKSPFMLLAGFTIAAVAAAVVVAALVHSPSPGVARLLSAPPLAWVGRISYGLYLWHFPLLFIAPKLMHGIVPVVRRVPQLDGVIAYALAFAAATLSYYALERPFLRWKDMLGRHAPRFDPLISARSSRRASPRILAASSGRAGCPA